MLIIIKAVCPAKSMTGSLDGSDGEEQVQMHFILSSVSIYLTFTVLGDIRAGINVSWNIHQGCPCDYLKLWRWSWVSLRSSFTPSELALGSANVQIMSDHTQAAWLWLAKLTDLKKGCVGH